MSLDKAIEHHKEHRKPYKGAKAVDRTCRNHGSCDWCMGNRLHSDMKRVTSAESQIEEYRMSREWMNMLQ